MLTVRHRCTAQGVDVAGDERTSSNCPHIPHEPSVVPSNRNFRSRACPSLRVVATAASLDEVVGGVGERCQVHAVLPAGEVGVRTIRFRQRTSRIRHRRGEVLCRSWCLRGDPQRASMPRRHRLHRRTRTAPPHQPTARVAIGIRLGALLGQHAAPWRRRRRIAGPVADDRRSTVRPRDERSRSEVRTRRQFHRISRVEKDRPSRYIGAAFTRTG